MRREALEWARRVTLTFIVVIALAIVYMSIRALSTRPASATPATVIPETPTPVGIPTLQRVEVPPTLTPVPLLRPTPSPEGPKVIRIGIVAGHHLNDSGAICPDGLREVDINLAVAERVVARLKRKGYTVDLLAEFDDQIDGYQADVFLSLHSDSCVIGLTGFKVARSQTSAIPEIEDKLVECLIASYEQVTGLPFNENTISEHMRDYHAFRKIAWDTPGAIIELGFMGDDRKMLLYRQDQLAQGLVQGIQCFLDSRSSSGPQPPAP